MSTSNTIPIPGSRWGYRHVILFTVWILYVINFMDRMAVLTFLPYISRDLELTPVQAGWLASIFFFGYALAQFSGGYLSDKFGAKKVMSIAIWVFTLATFLTGFVQSLFQFMCLRLGLALGEGHHWTPALKTIASWFPRHEKNRAYGFFGTSWGVGPAITPVMATTISAYFFAGAWKPIFFLLAIPGVIGVLLLYLLLYDSPREALQKKRMSREEHDYIVADVGQDVGETGKQYKTSLFASDPHFYLYTGAWMSQTMIFWGIGSWLTSYLVMQHSMDIKTMGFYATLPYIIGIGGSLLGGWLSDKVFTRTPKITPAAGYLFLVPALWAFNWVETGDHAVLLFLLPLPNLCVNILAGPLAAYPSLRYPKEIVGRSQGIANGISQFGSFISPLVAGYLVVTMPDKSLNFNTVFMFWTGIAVIGFICTALLAQVPRDTTGYEMTVGKAPG